MLTDTPEKKALEEKGRIRSMKRTGGDEAKTQVKRRLISKGKKNTARYPEEEEDEDCYCLDTFSNSRSKEQWVQ